MTQHHDPSKPFKGKTALVTGGTRGIGRATALALAEKGANIAFTYFRKRSDALETEKLLNEKGVSCLSIRANMGNSQHYAPIFSAIKEKFHHLDFVIHNAATGDLKPLLELTEEEWQRTIDINTKALILLAQHGVPLMKGRPGRFINISSHGSEQCLPTYGALGAAKAASESLIRYLAIELAPLGIGANTVMAGITDTVSLKAIPGHEELLKAARAKTPAGRTGTPDDIAKVICFLCSEDAQWIVGETVRADGGHAIVVG
jgi:enoyl-[acyl-carrier protein] reductase III